MTPLQLRTAGMLTAMFTENTGTHLLDSGGAYGRNWQRNQGKTLSDFLNAPSATWERDYGVTLSAWHFLNDRVTYSKTAEVLTRLMHVWELNDYENRNLYHGSDQVEFLETIGAEAISDWFNTYNWDNCLSQDLQFYEFELMGLEFVLLQVHGGADARGGYTLPVIFEVPDESWIYQCNEASLYCPNCHVSGNYGDCEGDWYRHGELEPDLFGKIERCFDAPSGYDNLNGCPECGGDLEAQILEWY